MKSMTTMLLVGAASLAVPARAFDGEGGVPAAPTGPKAAELATAQTTLTNAQATLQSATQAEVDAKARLAAAETAVKGAEGEAKVTMQTAAKQAKGEVTAATKAVKTAKSDLKKAETAVTKAQKAATAEANKLAKQATADAAKVKQPEQNGITRPKADSQTGKAWTIFDNVSQRNNAPASIGETLPLAKAAGINEATVRTQYARWRKFNGVSGRIAAPTPPAPPAPTSDVAPPAPPAPPPAG